jgi:NADH dehydrogenase
VVVLGGGFAGLAAVRGLADAPVRVVLLDRQNHHTFQPLLYQVATAALSPAQIAAPIRQVFASQANVEVVLGEVDGIDVDARRVSIVHADGRRGVQDYDALVVAAGATHSYFGRDDWAPRAPGLKTIDDALEIRKRFLLAFEAAEQEPDDAKRRALLTFIVIGAGPTGVELAGAISEISRTVLRRDFRRIDTRETRVLLIEALDRVLPGMSPTSSRKAADQLRELGVELRLATRVLGIDGAGVTIQGGARIDAACVLWAAGVKASPLGAMLDAELDRAGRVRVGPDLSIPGHPEVFVAGDLASVMMAGQRAGEARPVPGVAPAAMQMGRYAAARIKERVERGWSAPLAPAPAFEYRDKGSLATIGRARAVGEVLGMHLSGFVAWMFWALVHVAFLVGFRNRWTVMWNWGWDYVFFERGARLITGRGTPGPRARGDGVG